MTKDWMLQTKEIKKIFSKSTWIPLRQIMDTHTGDCKEIGYISDFFGCGSVAFPPQNRKIAERLGWSDISTIQTIQPYAYKDGYYSSIEQYQYIDKKPIGIHLVFEYLEPVIKTRRWIINPDMIVALGLIKEGDEWIRPEEDFTVVIREKFDEVGNHSLIEIKLEFLIDYLAARNLSLRLSYYRQRIENIQSLAASNYNTLESHRENQNGGEFELTIRSLNEIYGEDWEIFKVSRNDIDTTDDVPIIEEENDENTVLETNKKSANHYTGIYIESEFWRSKWIDHNKKSIRVRKDINENLPLFIVDTSGQRMKSADLNNEEIGRWLWFRPNVINELITHRGFCMEWYTAKTGCINSTSGYKTHFGINDSDLITIYAYDIARLASWEQFIWAGYNIAPEGGVCDELLASQIELKPANTYAPEYLLLIFMKMLENNFAKVFNTQLYTHDIDDLRILQQISRFSSTDQPSLLRLAKELTRVFIDRLNINALRNLSTDNNKKQLGSIKLLENIVANKIGKDEAYKLFSVIIGVYNMRLGDAHPTSSNIKEAYKLAEINSNISFLKQGEQLIYNFSKSICFIEKSLFGTQP